MGKDRAANVIPKKLNISMLDVFDVQLGNFTVMTIFRNTRDAMLISLPREKTLEEDPLDLHIVLSAHCSGSKRLTKGPVTASAVPSQGNSSGQATSPTKYSETVSTDSHRPEKLADAADPSNCPKEEDDLSTSCPGEDSAMVEDTENTAATVQSNAFIEDEVVNRNKLSIAEAGHTTSKGKTAIDEDKKAGTDVQGTKPPESAGEYQLVQAEAEEDEGKDQKFVKVEPIYYDKDEDQKLAETDVATPTVKSSCQEKPVAIELDATEHDSGGENQESRKTNVTGGSELEPDPVIVNSDVTEPISDNKYKARKTKQFLSSERCAGIVNGNNINFVTECLKICGLQRGEAADKNRAEVLEYIQSINEGST